MTHVSIDQIEAPNRRVICITDSLGLQTTVGQPESDPKVSYIELAKSLPLISKQHLVIDVLAETGRTSQGVVTAIEGLEFDPPPFVVLIQVGVVDCAPRLLGPRMRYALGQLRPKQVRNAVFWLLRRLHHRWVFRWFGHRLLVGPKAFRCNLERAIELLRDRNVVHILLGSVLPTTDAKEKVFVGFEKNINKYNQIIESVASCYNVEVIRFDSLFDGCESMIYDGVHPTHAGKLKMASLFADVIGGYADQVSSKR